MWETASVALCAAANKAMRSKRGGEREVENGLGFRVCCLRLNDVSMEFGCKVREMRLQ